MLRLIETLPDGKQVFRRRSLEAVLALRTLVEGPARTAFDHIDQVISAFVGEHDYMQLSEVDALIADLDGAALESFGDQQLAQLIIEKGYGAQRIASQVIFKDPRIAGQQLPLDRSFALLGQRYVADSHVFSNVVYERVIVPGAESRFLPNPLDAAYAAIANDAALPLLQPELERFGYAPHLERMRALIDAHGESYWSATLHVGTGLPRLMVVTANTCEGARAYAGVASSYHEVITGLDRLTDPDWAARAKDAEDVPWMKPVLP